MSTMSKGTAFVLILLLFPAWKAAQTSYPSVGGDQIRTETYLIPAPTSGPMSPAWSPDGEWIAFSMWGSIWRVRVGGGVAEELTSGPGYDYQPAYGPGGKIAFVRDRDKQVDIWKLDETERQITDDSAVDLLPGFTPSGEILFYSSRAGNFDIWTSAGAQLTTDRSRDMQPSHSPRDPIIAFVSGREASVGSGGIWTKDLESGNVSLIHFEEGVYRTRPAFSPDGREVLFSSGGDLWRIPAAGGIPVRITFDEPNEELEGRWSPDGKQVVYVSDARGLRIVPRGGGYGRPVSIIGYEFKRPAGTLSVQIDGPSRVSIVASDGRAYTPEGSYHHVSNATDTHYFYAAGPFEIDLPAGPASITVSRGFGYAPWEGEVSVPGSVEVDLDERFPLPGWYSGDTHVHDRHSGIYRLLPEDMALGAAAEDLNVTNMLIHVDGTKLQGDMANFTGEDDLSSTPDHILHYSQEYRTTLGHIALLGPNEFVFPFFSGVQGTSLRLPAPPIFEVAAAARERGATIGIPHPYYSGMAAGSVEGVDRGRGATEIPVDVALGLMDYYDINCIWADELESASIYYKLLNSGFRLPVAGGTDSFSDVPRDPPMGAARTFVRVDGSLSFESWLRALREGKSFATSGPLLALTVDGNDIGAELEFSGPASVHVEARVMSIVPVDRLEIIVNGQVVASTAEDRVSMELDLDRSSWIVARAVGPSHPLVGDEYAFAHTSPIYAEIGGAPVSVREDKDFFIRYVEGLKTYVESLPWDDPETLESYRNAYDRAIAIFRQ
jgi:TolB protein